MSLLQIIRRIFNGKPAMKIALCVGHSRYIEDRIEGGAVSVAGDNGFAQNEWGYNQGLALLIETHLKAEGYEVLLWKDYDGNTYGQAMRWLAKQIGESGADCAIELHFNAAAPAANGHEWLFWRHSDESRLLAYAINTAFVRQVPSIKQRGIKPLYEKSRGASFCRLTPCPAVIAEPFFGTNPGDWRVATERKEDIAKSIADGIHAWCEESVK